MKRVLALVMILMIILTGCSNAKNDSQDINKQATDDKVMENASEKEENQDAKNTTKTVSDNDSDEKINKSSNKQGQVKDIETNEEINNQFFFKDIAAKKQYTYKGTIWGDTVVEGEKPEKTNDNGDVYVIAKLNISEITRFRKGKLYEFDFAIYSERNNTEEMGQKEYYWVTEDKIYSFSPPKDFDANNFVKNGILDCLSCAKAIEKDGLLPSNDESLLICSNSSIKLYNENKLVTEEIVVKNDICKYSYEHNNAHFQTLEWKIGKGLTQYAWGYGAKREGMKLELVE